MKNFISHQNLIFILEINFKNLISAEVPEKSWYSWIHSMAFMIYESQKNVKGVTKWHILLLLSKVTCS